MGRLPIALLLLSLAFPVAAETLRCANKLVSLNDRAFQVLQKCGEPTHRDPIGYTLGAYDRREFTMEEWVYGPTNGMYSILTFEGNRLVRIETRRDR